MGAGSSGLAESVAVSGLRRTFAGSPSRLVERAGSGSARPQARRYCTSLGVNGYAICDCENIC